MDVPAQRSDDQLTLVIPVYNEGANFPSLWKEVASQIRSPFRALVVYDFDEDNTVPVAQQIISQGERRLVLVKNVIARGVVDPRNGLLRRQVAVNPGLPNHIVADTKRAVRLLGREVDSRDFRDRRSGCGDQAEQAEQKHQDGPV